MSRSPVWMWQYGEYELYHNMLLHARREEFGAKYPPTWRVASVSPWLQLYCDFTAPSEGTARLTALGIGFLVIDDVRYPAGVTARVSAGKHSAYVRVMNEKGFPAAFIESDVCPSGEGWYAKRLPARLGEAEEVIPAGCEPVYPSLNVTPDTFPFAYAEAKPVVTEKTAGGTLYDFGKERFSRVCITAAPDDTVTVTYGESRAEALAGKEALLFEGLTGKREYTLPSRALRYLFVEAKGNAAVRLFDELPPAMPEASYASSDTLMNDILRISADTFRLCSREFYLDGIKRDRWVWSGDSFQSYMIDRYFRRDKDIMRRTILALGGDGVYTEHINTITDYSLYWLISIEEYHKHYGDDALLRYIYPKMQSLVCFCETRLNAEGFIEGADGDWVFVDWTDYDKTGAVCAEQILLRRAYEAMAYVASLLGKDAARYTARAEELKDKIARYYWCEEKGAFIDSYVSGKKNVTRHANILAVLFGYADEEMRESILHNVLLNESVTKITTPYFAFYEMDALARLGQLSLVTERVREYWGGMLRLGATSVWEEYVPEKTGVEHYEMYGNRFGKSLCHAWGAGPLYLFGRYYLGVESGDGDFRVSPDLAGLESVSGEVPLADGFVRVSADASRISVYTECKGGVLCAYGKEYPIPVGVELVIEKE